MIFGLMYLFEWILDVKLCLLGASNKARTQNDQYAFGKIKDFRLIYFSYGAAERRFFDPKSVKSIPMARKRFHLQISPICVTSPWTQIAEGYSNHFVSE